MRREKNGKWDEARGVRNNRRWNNLVLNLKIEIIFRASILLFFHIIFNANFFSIEAEKIFLSNLLWRVRGKVTVFLASMRTSSCLPFDSMKYWWKIFIKNYYRAIFFSIQPFFLLNKMKSWCSEKKVGKKLLNN